MEYNPEHVWLGMIQGITSSHYSGKLKMDESAKNIRYFKTPSVRKRKRSNGSDSSQEYISNDDLPNGLIEYIKNCGGVIRSAKRDENFISMIVGGMWCPFIKGKHKSNNTYFTLCVKNKTGWWKCSDDDCPKIHYDRINLDWIF